MSEETTAQFNFQIEGSLDKGDVLHLHFTNVTLTDFPELKRRISIIETMLLEPPAALHGDQEG